MTGVDAAAAVQVRGDGIVGRALALALARIGLRVGIVGAKAAARRADVRAYALNAGSVALLRRLGAWDTLPADARTPVYEIDVRGDAGAALAFSAYEQRVGELAVIVDAAALEDALGTAIKASASVRRFDADADAADIEREAGEPPALVVHAEGRLADAALGPAVAGERRDYRQRAVAARLVATRPHGHVARQWFHGADVLALLPFDRPEPGCSHALVWSLPAGRAETLLVADAETFERSLADATGGAAGELRLASERAAWPLHARRAVAWCGPGWVLVGDAAHVVHPLAGQGLNLGLADVAALTETLGAREPWRGIGDERLLRRYVRQRLGPTDAMLRITDGLQRLFGLDSPLPRQLRNNGLTLVNRIRPLKHWLADRALDSR